MGHRAGPDVMANSKTLFIAPVENLTLVVHPVA